MFLHEFLSNEFEVLYIFVHLSSVSIESTGNTVGKHFLFLLFFLFEELELFDYFLESKILTIEKKNLCKYFGFFSNVEELPLLLCVILLEGVFFCILDAVDILAFCIFELLLELVGWWCCLVER